MDRCLCEIPSLLIPMTLKIVPLECLYGKSHMSSSVLATRTSNRASFALSHGKAEEVVERRKRKQTNRHRDFGEVRPSPLPLRGYTTA